MSLDFPSARSRMAVASRMTLASDCYPEPGFLSHKTVVIRDCHEDEIHVKCLAQS